MDHTTDLISHWCTYERLVTVEDEYVSEQRGPALSGRKASPLDELATHPVERIGGALQCRGRIAGEGTGCTHQQTIGVEGESRPKPLTG
jgi:hypothetical protein